MYVEKKTKNKKQKTKNKKELISTFANAFNKIDEIIELYDKNNKVQNKFTTIINYF
jgi:hypothetical protein